MSHPELPVSDTDGPVPTCAQLLDVDVRNAVIEKHLVAWLRAAQHQTHDRHRAEDAVHDGVLRVLHDAPHVATNPRYDTMPMHTYIRGAVDFAVLRQRKRGRFERRLFFRFLEKFDVVAARVGTEELLDAAELRTIIEQLAVRHLSPRQRQAWQLRADGLSREQIAQALGCAPSVVHTHIVRALEKHRKTLTRAGYLDEDSVPARPSRRGGAQ